MPAPHAPDPATAAILDRMRDAVLVADAAGTVVHANAAARRLFAAAGTTADGAPLATLVPGVAVAIADDAPPATVALPGLAGWYEVTGRSDATGTTVVLHDVTDAVSERAGLRRLAEIVEATVRASERLHRTVVREIPGGAIALLDRELRLVLCDGGGLQAIGVDGSSYVGRALDEFATPPVTEVLLPAVRRVLDGESVTFQVVVAGHPLEMRGVPIADDAGPPTHALLLGIDVSAREAARTALEASERRLQDAIDLVTDGIYEWDVVEDRVRGSSKLSAMLGYAGDAAAPTVEGWFALVHPDDVATARERLARHLAGETPVFEVEYRVRAASGEWRWVADRGRVVARDATGRPLRLLGANRDITGRRALEERLRRSQKLEAVGQLAGGLAHDFNNLLTVVRGHARFLLDALPAGRARRDADAIRVASERAAGLTRQLLMLSRREVSVPRRIAPDRVVAGYAELLDRVLGDHVVLELALGAGDRPVLLDPVHLEQVLLNLALNARDAMADEGTLRIATAWVAAGAPDVPIEAPRGAVRLTVQDSGAGMDAATAARAFEPFFTTKPPGHGTGIGLATVLGIVEQAGGHVWLESAPGTGTTVHFLFPVADGVVDAPAHAIAPGVHATDGPVRILLVEDEPDVRAITRRTLEDAGCEVLACDHGVAALARWLDESAAGRRIDALVSDLRMPRMNGRDLARALREEDPALPVLLVSGFDDAAAADGEAWLGAPFRFVAKPFGPETLVTTLVALLRDGAAARAATPPGAPDLSGQPAHATRHPRD